MKILKNIDNILRNNKYKVYWVEGKNEKIDIN